VRGWAAWSWPHAPAQQQTDAQQNTWRDSEWTKHWRLFAGGGGRGVWLWGLPYVFVCAYDVMDVGQW